MSPVEDGTPTMKDLNSYVTEIYATKWKNIGIELGLNLEVMNIIETDHHNQCVVSFQKTLNKWLKKFPGATWRALEVALTNVTRQSLGLDPVDNVYGEDFYVEVRMMKN